ncbi:6-hydroxymethylpterin diphosphokinase MptE-like protein [Candidatus Protochlamydia sp. W-9]|uniref:6-hydroxymethylpterin diphosphokinase MptE-like protein n=1 Tax=Candidatus Protochlamydia sp. W-9 TaxID=1785087 RepID=UPI00096A2C89|nr:6-hydroxymethylpterin diphosphokinase MptE-like protein [Candidatus Protochlamydia sp. W-9]
MSNPNLFNQNLSLLGLFNPLLAVKLQSLPNVSSSAAKQEDVNVFIHKENEALEQASIWIRELELENCDVLYIYGLGLGYAYDVLQPWLKTNRHRYLVFLEDETAVIHYFLQTEKSSILLKDPQVDIIDISEAQYDRKIIRSITEDHILRSFAITALPSYSIHKANFFATIKDLIEFESAELNIRYQELAQFGIVFFNNFYRNLFQLPQAYLADNLVGKFKDIPAIICGAGPSLNKQAPLLKNLYDKAVLFAPGSALNILSHQGVWPHFGVNIDPTPETFHRQVMNKAFETPIFYRHRLYYEALTAIHAPRLFLSGAVYYSVAKWFEEQFNLPSLQLEGGYNVVHTALEIAHFLGCNPIIFVGLDLSYQEGEHYASGVERHPLFPQKTDQKTHLGQPLQVKNKKGEYVWSYWPWIAEAQWIDLYQRSHPDLKIFNASEEGIGLFSIPNLSLEELTQSHLSHSFDINEMVHHRVQEAGEISVSHLQVKEVIKTFYLSLKNCENTLQDILNTSKENGMVFPDKLKQEPGFNYLLSQFDDFFMTFIQKDLRNLNRIPNDLKMIKERELTEERYHFLWQTCKVNLTIIENTLKENSPANQTLSVQHFPLFPNSDRQSTYYASGNVYSTSSSLGRPFEGTHYYFYEDGTLKSEINYQKNILNGVVKLYYPHGQIKRELYFWNGQREGVEKSWYENGQLFTEVIYHQNLPKQARCWFPDGTIAKDVIL